MKESKAVYVTKRDIRENLLHREYQLYANNIISNNVDVKQHTITNDVGIQYNSRRDNLNNNHRNVSNSKRYNDYDSRYHFSPTPKQIFTYHKSRSFTDIGVGSVKALQKKKVRRIYLPETDDRGVGSSDLSAFVNRIQSLQNKSKTKHHRVLQSYYETKRTSSKCVGGAIDTRPECLVSAKVSPIIHTRSATTSSPAVASREKPIESKENKEIETGSSHFRQKEFVSTDTQFEEIEYETTVIRTPGPVIEETQSPAFILLDKPSEPKVIESLETTSKPKVEEVLTKKPAAPEPLKDNFSSDSLVQHVHNLEQPSEYSKQRDPMENKMEREYRKMFASISKENQEKNEKVAESKNIPQKSTSLFRRRFTAIRKSLGKKDSKNNMGEEQGSVPSVRDASITSDPPSLEERSLSSIKGYRSKEHRKKQRKLSYKKSYTGKKTSKTWSKANPVDSEYAQGVKGMFKLWGKKFNLEDSTDNKEDTTQPSSFENKRFDRGEEIVKNIVEAVEDIEEENKPEKEIKKETKKFFFFKRKHSKDKSKNESPPYKSKKGVTTGRCEVKDGLSIRMGAGRTTPAKATQPVKQPVENNQDLKRAAWLMNYLSNPKESRNSVKIRWNSKTYATSSSTIFELYKNVYKSTGVVLRSKSEMTTEPSSTWSNRNASYVQKIQAYMLPETIPDRQPPIVLVNKLESPPLSETTKSKSLNESKSTKFTISDQNWFIDKSKAFAHKIEVVLHSNNFVKLEHPESEYLRIDIPKGFFSGSSSDEYQHGHGHSSDEEVYNIVEYESLNNNPELKKAKIKPKVADFGNQNHESQSVQVTISVKSGLGEESNVLETVIKRPPVHRDVVIQGGNVYIPKKCDVIGVGIITRRDVRETGQPMSKIMDYLSDESEHSLPKKSVRNSEFAKAYMQDYYRQWQPLGIDMFSWCYSDSHLECCSEHNSKDSHNVNYGDVAKSCPNIYREYITLVSSYSSICCLKPGPEGLASLTCLNDLTTKQPKKEKEKKKEDKKKKKDDLDGPYRVLPKDSLEVFKKRKVYAREKLNWICDKIEPYSIPSNAETGVQGKDCCRVKINNPQGILSHGKEFAVLKKVLKISSNAVCTIPDSPCCVSGSCPPEQDKTCNQPRNSDKKSKCANRAPDEFNECSPEPLPPILKAPNYKPPRSPPQSVPCALSPATGPKCPPKPYDSFRQPYCQDSPTKSPQGPVNVLQVPKGAPSPPRGHKDCSDSCCQPSCPRSPSNGQISPKSSPKQKSPVRSPTSPNRCKTMYPFPQLTGQRPATPPQQEPLEIFKCPPPCPPKPPPTGRPPSPPPCPHSPSPKPPPKICPLMPQSSKCPIGFKFSNSDGCMAFPKPRRKPSRESDLSSPLESLLKLLPCPPDWRTRPKCPSPPKTPPKYPPPKPTSPKCRSPPKTPPKCLPTCPKCKKQNKKFPEKSDESGKCPDGIKISNSGGCIKLPPTRTYPEPRKSRSPSPSEGKDNIAPCCRKQPCCPKKCKQKTIPSQSERCEPVSSATSFSSSYCASVSSHQNEQDCVCPGDSVTAVTKTHSAPAGRPMEDCSKPLDSGPRSQPNIGRRAKFSGIFFRKFPKPAPRDCSKAAVIQINSKGKIMCNLEDDDKASTRGMKDEEGFMKICDENGKVLVERKDYSSVKKTVPLINNLFNESEVNRVTAPITVNEIASVERENKLKESKSTDSIVNIIEINFKLRVIQGDKTTEINIANEDGNVLTEAPTSIVEHNLKQNSCMKNSENLDRDKEVYIVKDDDPADDINPKNDLNIRILIKNYKPKIDSLKERKAVNEFSKKISKKFTTVSTGYNVDTDDVGSPDQCFSIHRATIDLTTSEKSKAMTPPKENVIPKKSEVRFTDSTKIVSDARLSHSLADTNSKAISYSERYGSGITFDTEISEPARLTTKSLPLLGKKSGSWTIRKSSQSSDPSAFLEAYEDISSKSMQKISRSDNFYTTDKTESIEQKQSKKSIQVKDIFKYKVQTSFTDTYDRDLSIGNKTSDEPADLLDKTSEEPTEATEPLTKSSEDRTFDAKTSEDQLLSDTKTSNIKVVKIQDDAMNYLNMGKTKKEERKKILKQVFDNASLLEKPKKKNRMQKLKDMLKALLTSDTDSETSIAVTENELTKEIRRCCQPMTTHTSDSLNNFLDTKSLVVSKTVSDAKPLRTSAAGLVQTHSNESGNSEDVAKPVNRTCLCNDFAKKLNLQNIFGGGGGCCCAKKKPGQISQQISCNIYKEVSLEDYGFYAPSVECIHCQTNNSRYKSSIHCAKVISISSKRTSFIGPPMPEPIKYPETLCIVPLSSDHLSNSKHCKNISSKQSHFEETSLERETRLDATEEKNTIFLETKATTISRKGEVKKKRKHNTKSRHQADVLQMYETKKAVLEIYAEKTVTDTGEHLVAKLPKFVRDTESQLYESYEKLGQRSYKSVYKRNYVMMCIGR